jgi:hypothetical protein
MMEQIRNPAMFFSGKEIFLAILSVHDSLAGPAELHMQRNIFPVHRIILYTEQGETAGFFTMQHGI